jgi:hypothetical protein
MVEAERDFPIMEINWAGMSVYLATPTTALAKAGALISDGEKEAVEAVMDVDVAKDCTVAMVADTVELRITGAMSARNLKTDTNPTQASILTHVYWLRRIGMGT